MHQQNRERGVREAGDSRGCEERRREAPRFHNFLCGHYELFRLTRQSSAAASESAPSNLWKYVNHDKGRKQAG